MAVTLRSGIELEERRVKKKDNEEKKHADIGKEFKHHSSETNDVTPQIPEVC